jgi:hypothetical protein
MTARPLSILLYTPTKHKVWMDGEVLSVGRLDLRPGRHVLAVRIGAVDRDLGLLMVVLTHDPSERPRKDTPHPIVEPPLRILSAADGSWRFCLERPAKGWQGLGFDDSASWEALVRRDIPAVDWSAPNGYQWRKCQEATAAGLGVPRVPEGTASRGLVWVRKVFEIPLPPTS